MKTKKTVSANNVFQTIVRKVIKEELIPINNKIDVVGKRMGGLANNIGSLDNRMNSLDNRMDLLEDNVKSTISEYVDKVLTGQDQIMGELRTIRQEQIMHQGQHDDLNSLPIKMENLEKIHPKGQHALV